MGKQTGKKQTGKGKSKQENLVKKELQYFECLWKDLKSRENTIKQYSGAEQNERAVKSILKS